MRDTGLPHVVLALGLGLALLVGCEQKGAAQKAGEKVDKAVEGVGKEIQKAGEKAGDKLDEAARKVKDATK
jgi:hyperosmotically inducible periplasmic protein